MQDQSKIRTASERNAKAVELRPSMGRGTAVTTVRLREGFSCEVEEGKWKFTVGMSEKSGGVDDGPNPGVIGRGTLGSCLALSYAMWAARLEVPITSLEVEVQADYDARGMYGVGDVPAGYEQIRWTVTVGSEAPEDDVMRMLDESDSHCDFLHVFRHPQDIQREVRLLTPQRR